MYNMATLIGSALMSNPILRKVGTNIVGKVADKGTDAILGGVGGAIGGRKGKRVGKQIAKGLGMVRRKVFGFNSGGKVRKTPMMVTGYNAGGVIVKPLLAARRRLRK